MPRLSRPRRRRRDSSPSGGIEVGVEVLRRPRGRYAASARRRWLAFALARCCSSSFRFSRLRPTHAAEALAATVAALAATAALGDAAGEWASPRAAEAWGALAPSAWRVLAGWALVPAPSASHVSAARELAIAPSAWRASAGRISEAAPSQAAVWPGVHWRRRVSRPRGSRARAAALAPPRRARSRDREYAPPAWAAAACSATAPSPTWRGARSSRRRDSTAGSSGRAG